MALIFESIAQRDEWIAHNGGGPWSAVWDGIEPGRFREQMSLPWELDRDLGLTEQGVGMLQIHWNGRTTIAFPGDTFTITLIMESISP